MKLEARYVGTSVVKVVTANFSACEVTLREVFSGVLLVTDEGKEFGVCMRDNGLEIVTPDDTLIGLKLDTQGNLVVERNCKTIWAKV